MVLPPAFAKEENTIYAIIETPCSSKIKYDYNQQNDFFQLKKVLPSGISFPFDFGFIPHTLADDGKEILLMKDGKKQNKNLLKALITEEDILEAIRRDVNSSTLDKIKEVYIERSGDISIIKE